MTATIGAVSVLLPLDGGRCVRCVGCSHPARVTPDRVPPCPVCGRSLANATPCTDAEYRASRADDAPVPFVSTSEDAAMSVLLRDYAVATRNAAAVVQHDPEADARCDRYLATINQRLPSRPLRRR